MVYHVTVVSLLMILGKMMLLFCYRKEANLRTRLALSLGMCPRGEVGVLVLDSKSHWHELHLFFIHAYTLPTN